MLKLYHDLIQDIIDEPFNDGVKKPVDSTPDDRNKRATVSFGDTKQMERVPSASNATGATTDTSANMARQESDDDLFSKLAVFSDDSIKNVTGTAAMASDSLIGSDDEFSSAAPIFNEPGATTATSAKQSDDNPSTKWTTTPSTFSELTVTYDASIGNVTGTAATGSNSRIESDDGLFTTITHTAPETLHASCFSPFSPHEDNFQDCAICSSSLQGSRASVRLNGCGHAFHRDCIVASLQHKSNCPTCQTSMGKLPGTMPSGTMQITRSASIVCAGFPPGTLVISYDINGGVQKAYHSNPGCPYSPSTCTAYLPDNAFGRVLLKRHRYAFSQGLTFTVEPIFDDWS